MKTHAIIPIFIPHLGCPNDCVFCNQKTITARLKAPSREEIADTVNCYLKTITGRGIETIEIAFYGGSFTGLPMELQQEYLAAAKSYKDLGLINKIHLSTRPDYIDDKILTNLKNIGADIIELGVQSFDEEVLRRSGRGHDTESVYAASRLIKAYEFELGLQLMIGLPGDTYEKSIYSAKEAVKIAPSVARLYPTVIIRDTALYDMCLRGEYTPLSQKDAVLTAKDMYLILKDAGINVIRIGLKSTDLISVGGETAGGYHPAFRQLVESEIAKEQLEIQLLPLLVHTTEIKFRCNSISFSNMIGNCKSNQKYFKKKYPHVRFSFHVDNMIPKDVYLASAVSCSLQT